jgi:hypothetical protein
VRIEDLCTSLVALTIAQLLKADVLTHIEKSTSSWHLRLLDKFYGPFEA